MTAARSMWVARHDQSIDRWITGSPPIAGLTATADLRWWLVCRRRDTYSLAAAKVDGPRIRFTSSSSNPARGQIKGKATTRAETHRLRKEIKQHPGTGKNTRDAREKEKHGSGAESTRTTRRCCLAGTRSSGLDVAVDRAIHALHNPLQKLGQNISACNKSPQRDRANSPTHLVET